MNGKNSSDDSRLWMTPISGDKKYKVCLGINRN
jgi:hypothetical protein